MIILMCLQLIEISCPPEGAVMPSALSLKLMDFYFSDFELSDMEFSGSTELTKGQKVWMQMGLLMR